MAGSLTASTKGLPYPVRNWVIGDSTTRGLAYDSSGVTPVPYLFGWPRWLPSNKLPYNCAVAGHFTWEVENDLFGPNTLGASLARTNAAGAPNPNQLGGRMPRPDRVIIMTGANDILSYSTLGPPTWNSANIVANATYFRAVLIQQLLANGLVPYVPSRSVGDGITDFLLMTTNPWVFTGAGTGGASPKTAGRIGLNAASITQFGQIDNTALGGSSSGSFGQSITYSLAGGPAPGYPTFTLDCSAKKCMLDIETVLKGTAGTNLMDVAYNNIATDGTFGVHLNQLGERTLAAAMAPYFLASP